MADILRDASGREIRVGDLLRNLHFIGRRGKRYYQYWLVGMEGGQLRAAAPHEVVAEYGFRTSNLLSTVCRAKADLTIIDGYACRDGEVSYEDRPRVKEPTDG